MSKYFREDLPWTEDTASKRGLPRPFVNVPLHLQKALSNLPIKKGFYLHPKVPMQFTARPRLTDRLTDLIVDNEQAVVRDELCGYCGEGFTPEQVCTIWKRYDVIPHMEGPVGPRVFSDHYPFHLECMDQALIFCPYMRTVTTTEEFETGKHSDLILKSRAYKEFIETRVHPFIQRNIPE